MAQSRYYWIKLKTDFFNESAIDFLLSQKNGCAYVVLYQMLCLKCANTNGFLHSTIGEIIIPYDVEKIVRDTKYFDFDTVTVALELYKKLGLIYTSENNILAISNYEEMVGSETKYAVQKREYRKRKNADNLLDNDKTMSDKSIEYRDKSIENRDNIKDKEKDKKETYVSIISRYTQNLALSNSLKDFVEMRKKMKGFTTRALELALNNLDKLASDDETKILIVNQTIENSWKSFYPLKNNNKSKISELPSWYENQDLMQAEVLVDDDELKRLQEALK